MEHITKPSQGSADVVGGKNHPTSGQNAGHRRSADEAGVMEPKTADREIDAAANGFKELAHDISVATQQAVDEGAEAAASIESFVADVTGTSGHERVPVKVAIERAAHKE